MNKVKTAIAYEVSRNLKVVGIFYAIIYAIRLLIFLISKLSTGSIEGVIQQPLEFQSIFFVLVFGVLGFKDDFKMLMQNGFTRKYIFVSTACLFIVVAIVMAFVETGIGQILHYSIGYQSLFGGIYGYGNIVANWICLTLFYLLLFSLTYLGTLVSNRAGQTTSIVIGGTFIGAVLIISALFKFVFPAELLNNMLDFATKAMGFTASGAINYFLPILTLLLIIVILGIINYFVIRTTELKA